MKAPRTLGDAVRARGEDPGPRDAENSSESVPGGLLLAGGSPPTTEPHGEGDASDMVPGTALACGDVQPGGPCEEGLSRWPRIWTESLRVERVAAR